MGVTKCYGLSQTFKLHFLCSVFLRKEQTVGDLFVSSRKTRIGYSVFLLKKRISKIALLFFSRMSRCQTVKLRNYPIHQNN